MLTIPSLEKFKPQVRAIKCQTSTLKPGTYKVIVGNVGHDAGFCDFTLPPCSKESIWVNICSGESIECSFPKETPPVAYALFMHEHRKRGYQLVSFSNPDNSTTVVDRGPISSTPKFSKSTLVTYSPDPVLGSRIALKERAK